MEEVKGACNCHVGKARRVPIELMSIQRSRLHSFLDDKFEACIRTYAEVEDLIDMMIEELNRAD